MKQVFYNFKWAYLAITMLGITQLSGVVNVLSFVNAVMIAATFAWMCYDILITRKFECLNSPHFDLLALFIISYAITILLNIRYGVVGNLKTFLFSISQFVLLYFFANKNKKSIISFKKMAITVWLFSTITALISVTMFFLRFTYVFESAGKTYRIGVVEGRLWGLFWDPNYAGVLVSLAISLLFYLIAINFFNFPWKKILAAVSAVIMYIHIVLAGSRIGKITLFLSVALSVGYLMPMFGNKVSLKRKVTSIIAMLLCGVLAWGGISPVKELMVGINNKIYEIEKQSGHVPHNGLGMYNPDLNAEELTMERKDVDKKLNISNGRFSIWKSALDIVKVKPIFGAGNRSYVEFARQSLPDGKIAQTGYTTHNDYINVLMSSGVVGATVMVLFIGFCVFDTIKALTLVKYRSQEFYLIWAAASVAAIIAVSCLTLNLIWYYNDTIPVIFWIDLGILMNIVGSSSKNTYCCRVANWVLNMIKNRPKQKKEVQFIWKCK